ncbi:MAG: hypothetical protein V3V02_05390 [Rhizobiaceae bacterium]
MEEEPNKLSARRVLDDVKIALERLDKESEEREIRITWYATIAMLRTSFEVLKKVDAKRSELIDKTVSDQWHRVKEQKEDNSIFWEFIKRERELLVHQYEMSADLEFAPLALVEDAAAELVYDDDGELYLQDFFTICDGYFIGHDGRDLSREGYNWVDQRVKEIETVLL